MGAADRLLYPVAVALHTRDSQEDYRWLAERGLGQLIGLAKDLHRGLIADQDGRPASTFLLVDQGARLGLVVANLPTSRQDHVRTHIDDTLVLEFKDQDRQSVYRVAAGLLTEEASAIRQKLLDYAETLFDRGGGPNLLRSRLRLRCSTPDGVFDRGGPCIPRRRRR